MCETGDLGSSEERVAVPPEVESGGEGRPDLTQLPDRVLARIVRGDAKGRAFGTPRNPRMPTIQELNPNLEGFRAGDLAEMITGRRHGIFTEQAESVSQMSHEEVIRFRLEDPISAVRSKGGWSLTGGHHRIAEIIKRVQSGQFSPDTIVRILVHD
jgi:hypothetical protein